MASWRIQNRYSLCQMFGRRPTSAVQSNTWGLSCRHNKKVYSQNGIANKDNLLSHLAAAVCPFPSVNDLLLDNKWASSSRYTTIRETCGRLTHQWFRGERMSTLVQLEVKNNNMNKLGRKCNITLAVIPKKGFRGIDFNEQNFPCALECIVNLMGIFPAFLLRIYKSRRTYSGAVCCRSERIQYFPIRMLNSRQLETYD